MLRIEAMDHIVLTVDDVERSLAWYRDALGLEPLRYDEWQRGEVPFPSVRINDETIIDIVAREAAVPRGTNVDHFCLVVAPTDFDTIVASGAFRVRTGPVDRWGARGMATSIYISDPDGNTVELRHYRRHT